MRRAGLRFERLALLFLSFGSLFLVIFYTHLIWLRIDKLQKYFYNSEE